MRKMYHVARKRRGSEDNTLYFIRNTENITEYDLDIAFWCEALGRKHRNKEYCTALYGTVLYHTVPGPAHQDW